VTYISFLVRLSFSPPSSFSNRTPFALPVCQIRRWVTGRDEHSNMLQRKSSAEVIVDFCCNTNVIILPEVKRPWHVADHSLPSVPEVKNERNCISTPRSALWHTQGQVLLVWPWIMVNTWYWTAEWRFICTCSHELAAVWMRVVSFTTWPLYLRGQRLPRGWMYLRGIRALALAGNRSQMLRTNSQVV
jgi:hypothetical protein